LRRAKRRRCPKNRRGLPDIDAALIEAATGSSVIGRFDVAGNALNS